LDNQDRAALENIEFLTVYAFGNILQKPWLPLTAAVGLKENVNNAKANK